ncbi:protein-methionine-sulfoxide reductase heme-binding subunit MsrQ [Roseovarius sp. SYSU LYC5161]|uniref:protein-methionine-sulfoxide reductase heme-binding subunit MsrQ n=1 Tax=Roseovarius halophilus (ex Wu et al. 2025) TaxID=3376060 RepID=UPI00399A707A
MNAAVETVNRGIRRIPAWPLYLLGLVPAVWLFWLGTTGRLGVEPIEVLEHELGEIALQLMVAVLAVTPLRRLAGVNLLKFRRAIGVLAFVYVTLHLLVWLLLDVAIPAQIWADILKRPYVTVGFTAFLLMVPLAVTSNNWSVRRLGATWRRLHMLTYAAALLAAIHFFWLVKGFQIEPLIYLVVILGLLALRIRRPRKKQPA